MFQERRKSEKARLESLLRISQYNASSTQDLLDFALGEAISLAQSAIGYIYFYSEKSRQFTLNTWSKGVMEVCSVRNPETVYGLEKTGIWGEAVRQARPIILNDFSAPNPLKKGCPEGHAPLNRFMTLPVISEGAIVAVLGLANKEEDYTETDTQQLTLLMNSVWQIAERKRVEDELRKSEEKYRTILETMEEGYIEHDMAGTIYFANDSACRLTGYSKEKIIGLNYKLLVSVETAKKMFSVYNRIFSTRKPESLLDFEIIHSSGKNLQVELNVSLMVDTSGEPSGFRVVGRDVTKRREAEEALRRSEEKYRSILENISEGYFESHLNGKIRFVNEAAQVMMGYDRETLCRIDYQQFSTPETAKRFRETYQQVFNTGAYSKIDDYEIIRGDGAVRIHQLTVGLILDEEGKPSGFRTVARDVTEQKEAAIALKKSEERIRLLFNNIPVPTFVWKLHDRDFVLEEFNSSALQFMGHTILGAIGQTADHFFIHMPRISQDIRQCHQTGKTLENQFWYTLEDQDQNRYVIVRYAFAPPDSVLMHVNDITAQKKAEEDLLHISIHDTLTGLYNRFYADAEIKRLGVSRARPVSVIIVDLNDLKKINDKEGHARGDQYIKDAATVLKQTFRPEDMVARIGGDEFLVLLPLTDENACTRTLIRLHENISRFNELHNQAMSLSAGFATTRVGDDLKDKIREADADMYRQKALMKDSRFKVNPP